MALTILDAGVVIGVLDENDAHHEATRAALSEVRESGSDIAVPASAYAEALVGPMTAGKRAVGTVDAFLEELPAQIVERTTAMAKEAARLRSSYRSGLRLPDALVIATAEVRRADEILTTDTGWPARSRMMITPTVRVLGPDG